MIQILSETKDLLLTGHVEPDGDSVGSLLGIYHAFDGKNKGWQMVLRDEVPENLRFLQDWNLIKKPSNLTIKPSAILLVDCSDIKRAGEEWLLSYYEEKIPCYVIDHHPSDVSTGDFSLVEIEAAATAEIVAAMIEEMGIELDREQATCLYTAIVSDTGCFRYLNTTPRSMQLCAKYLALGIDLEPIRIRLFEDRSFTNMRILSAAINSLQVSTDGMLAWMFVDQATMQKYQAGPGDCTSIVNFSLAVEGVKIGLFFEEYMNDVKVSLRSRRGYSVNDIAAAFGGGGHVMAAGCRVKGNLATVMPQILQAFKDKLK